MTLQGQRKHGRHWMKWEKIYGPGTCNCQQQQNLVRNRRVNKGQGMEEAL